MGFLIDTTLWIAIERGRLTAGDIHAITRQDPLYLSPVNLAEIRLGIDLMPQSGMRKTALAALRRMRRKPLLRITGDTGEVFGRLAARIKKMGRAHDHRVQDLWLAGGRIAPTRVHAPRLEVAEIAARGDLAVALLAGQPDLDVVGPAAAEADIPGAQCHHAIG